MTELKDKKYFRESYDKISESLLKEKVKAICKEQGAWYGMPVAGPYGRAGLPDFMILHRGCFMGIETKTEKGKATKLQQVALDAITAAGGVGMVVRPSNLWVFEDLLRSL